ncbi:hypothetical protein Ddye_028020, partial [Dipteronia dyeriana]
EHDLDKVVYGGPWSFDNSLIVMERTIGTGTIDSLKFTRAKFWVQIHQVPLLCMIKAIGNFLGGMIGQVLAVDGGASGVCVGKFLRVRVRVDITRPLKCCLRVDNFGDKTEKVMILHYERLPNHCFQCGMIDHTMIECLKQVSCSTIMGNEEFPLGIWI